MRKRPVSTIAVFCLLAYAPVTVAQPKAGPAKVLITPEHALTINGKRIFPIGFAMIPPPGAKTPGGKPALEELHDAGAIFIRTGPLDDGGWNDERLAIEKAYMDEAARVGMYCMPWLKELASIGPGELEKERSLRRIIRTFKDHPGMGIWKGADEPQWGRQPVGPIVRAYQVIKEEDPSHPVWIVQAPRGTIGQLRPYNPAYDIGGVDVYPIGYPPGTHMGRHENKDISAVGDYTRKMLRVVDGRKPIWLTLQIAWSGVEGRHNTLRFPTFPQQRFMTYQAIINGARGLVYFGGAIRSTLSDHDRPYGWNWTYWERVLRPVIEEIGDKSPLAEALCAPNSRLPVKAEGNAIEFCVREVGRDVFVLACCGDPQKTARVTFTGLPESLTGGDVLYESPRKVAAMGGTFTDWFAPYDVHVYKFTRR